jgi:hypothetical protein
LLSGLIRTVKSNPVFGVFGIEKDGGATGT